MKTSFSRRFNGSQRAALYLASGGACSSCGSALESGWHADHITAWSHGGTTDLLNGQALCPTCNLKKGKRMFDPSHDRQWAKDAFKKYFALRKPDFLVVATPGAGKTRLALRIAAELQSLGIIIRVVVVTPTDHLKRQWAEVAHLMGLELDPGWKNSECVPARDYHGVCVTYSQVASEPGVHRNLCRVPTLVIFDEIHHAGDGNAWGDSLRYAFEGAARRLGLSGTLFRSDNNKIPFVTYVDGKSEGDVYYTYAQALSDGVCRPILFPSYEGRMKWYTRGKAYDKTFRDELSQRDSTDRLRTALDPIGEWLPQVHHDAHERLMQIRADHHDAGALTIAKDCDHARHIAAILEKVTGSMPPIAISDDPDSSQIIAEFARGRHPWLVAVKMVSEGVDIPRLRVGVYSTNVTTELFFRQVCGRFIRMMLGLEDQNAYLFFPRDPILIGYAQEIKKERDHQLTEEIERTQREETPHDDKVMRLFLAISSTGQADDVIYDQDTITQKEIQEAEDMRQQVGAPPNYDLAILARLIRKVRSVPTVTAHAEVSTAKPDPGILRDQKKEVRGLIKRLVGQLVAMSDGEYDFKEINTRLIKIDDVTQDQATFDQLKARVATLERWIKEYRDGG